MELICLNCEERFELDPPEREVIQLECPNCHVSQPLVAYNGPLPQSVPDLPWESSAHVFSQTGGFRKPMQAFTGKKSSVFASRGSSGGKTYPEASTHEEVARPADRARPAPVQSDEKLPAHEGNAVVVRSPSGLVLEFPNEGLLVEWSAVVEDPAPYRVRKGSSGPWTPLDAYLGSLRTDTKPGPGAEESRTKVDSNGDAAKQESAQDEDQEQPGSSDRDALGESGFRFPTSHFQFKTAKSGRREVGRKVLVGVLVVALGTGVLVGAAYLAGLF